MEMCPSPTDWGVEASSGESLAPSGYLTVWEHHDHDATVMTSITRNSIGELVTPEMAQSGVMEA